MAVAVAAAAGVKAANFAWGPRLAVAAVGCGVGGGDAGAHLLPDAAPGAPW